MCGPLNNARLAHVVAGMCGFLQAACLVVLFLAGLVGEPFIHIDRLSMCYQVRLGCWAAMCENDARCLSPLVFLKTAVRG